MTLDDVLLLLGAGFLVANVRVLSDLLRYLLRRPGALLVWPSRRPPYFPVMVVIGAALGVLLVSNFATGRVRIGPVFGETMMFVYYAAAVPLSRQVRRGFYSGGIWTDSRFLPYDRIGGLAWREGAEVALVLIGRARGVALRLVVPGSHYGAARRLLRDKIAAHAIHFAGTSLDLGARDEREDV